jgi:hypothetical protein
VIKRRRKGASWVVVTGKYNKEEEKNDILSIHCNPIWRQAKKRNSRSDDSGTVVVALLRTGSIARN